MILIKKILKNLSFSPWKELLAQMRGRWRSRPSLGRSPPSPPWPSTPAPGSWTSWGKYFNQYLYKIFLEGTPWTSMIFSALHSNLICVCTFAYNSYFFEVRFEIFLIIIFLVWCKRYFLTLDDSAPDYYCAPDIKCVCAFWLWVSGDNDSPAWPDFSL